MSDQHPQDDIEESRKPVEGSMAYEMMTLYEAAEPLIQRYNDFIWWCLQKTKQVLVFINRLLRLN